MGLDAYVHCNCYSLGKTKAFPLQHLADYIRVSDDGDLYLDVADKDSQDTFQEWKQTACEHSGMMYLWERISNWSGYRYFQQALDDIGWENFPTLQEQLPEANAGQTTSFNATLILNELSRFRELMADHELPFLIDTHTGEVVYNYVEAYQGVFQWSKYYWLGVDHKGFFIASSPDKERRKTNGGLINESDMVFRSMRFEQRFLGEQSGDIKREVQYYDADTENHFICDVALVDLSATKDDRLDITQPRILHVEMRAVSASSYDYILNAIEAVCKASIRTGNPIIWT